MQDYGAMVRQLMGLVQPVGDVIPFNKRNMYPNPMLEGGKPWQGGRSPDQAALTAKLQDHLSRVQNRNNESFEVGPKSARAEAILREKGLSDEMVKYYMAVLRQSGDL
jgi:hypothetical protein